MQKGTNYLGVCLSLPETLNPKTLNLEPLYLTLNPKLPTEFEASTLRIRPLSAVALLHSAGSTWRAAWTSQRRSLSDRGRVVSFWARKESEVVGLMMMMG